MRMILSIFANLNFINIVSGDLLVFAPNEKDALKRLEVVFQYLQLHNLKLSPKFQLIQASVKFLHLIDFSRPSQN